MKEVDQVIEAYGSWPDAFAGKVKASSDGRSEVLV
jgi:hypothetical protein